MTSRKPVQLDIFRSAKWLGGEPDQFAPGQLLKADVYEYLVWKFGGIIARDAHFHIRNDIDIGYIQWVSCSSG